jgi:hypothetical protein
MQSKQTIAALALLALVACNQTTARVSQPTMTDEQALAQAKTALLANLKDPESAKISDMRRVESNGASFVCGRVNSKNSFGGYTGNAIFSVDSNGEALIGGESVNLSVWASPCWGALNR